MKTLASPIFDLQSKDNQYPKQNQPHSKQYACRIILVFTCVSLVCCYVFLPDQIPFIYHKLRDVTIANSGQFNGYNWTVIRDSGNRLLNVATGLFRACKRYV